MSATTAEVSTSIAASKNKVWQSLTDADAVKQYFMGATVRTDWKVGSLITWSGEWQGKKFEDKGKVLAFDPERRLSFLHWSPMGGASDTPNNYHVVTITLDGVEELTKVTLAQSNLEGGVTDDDRAHREDFEKNWSTMLEGLKQVAEKIEV